MLPLAVIYNLYALEVLRHVIFNPGFVTAKIGTLRIDVYSNRKQQTSNRSKFKNVQKCSKLGNLCTKLVEHDLATFSCRNCIYRPYFQMQFEDCRLRLAVYHKRES